MIRKSYFIRPTSSRNEDIREGLLAVMNLNSSNQDSGSISLIVNRTESFSNLIVPAIQEVSPQLGALNWEKVRSRGLSINNVDIRCETERTYTGHSQSILVVYPINSLLEKIDNTRRIRLVVVVTEELGWIRNWIDRWSANEIGQRTRASSSIEENVRKYLIEKLLPKIPVYDPRIHNDKTQHSIEECFRNAISLGLNVEPDELYDWLVWPNGLGHLMANDIAEIAAGVFSSDGSK